MDYARTLMMEKNVSLKNLVNRFVALIVTSETDPIHPVNSDNYANRWRD